MFCASASEMGAGKDIGNAESGVRLVSATSRPTTLPDMQHFKIVAVRNAPCSAAPCSCAFNVLPRFGSLRPRYCPPHRKFYRGRSFNKSALTYGTAPVETTKVSCNLRWYPYTALHHPLYSLSTPNSANPRIFLHLSKHNPRFHPTSKTHHEVLRHHPGCYSPPHIYRLCC
jgi:hypothetical protein